jgi:glycosidase
MGGDLRGIIQKMDYLLDLGINALYLNPIFASAANHRYHTNDYYQIDPTLGTMADFRALLDAAHRGNIKVILDGVFNHSGRGFFAFADVLDNGGESRYKDWYYIERFPLDAFGEGLAENYKGWWEMKDLPKLNTNTPAVRQYIMDVARYWIEQGIDGWRLDVPGEIDDDEFWGEFRAVVKGANPDAYILGEIWELDPRWVGDTHFDALMHYPFRDALTDLLANGLPLAEFAQKVEHFLTVYPHENVQAMYLSIGSHDTRRLLTKLGDDLNKVKLALLLQFAYPGAPAVYYGDEIGVGGEKDPQNRKAFPWDESEWNMELRGYVQGLAAARKRLPSLRRGDFRRVHLDEVHNLYAFARSLGTETALAVVNAGDETRHTAVMVSELGWHEGKAVEDVLTHGRYGVQQEVVELTLGPWSGVILVG